MDDGRGDRNRTPSIVRDKGGGSSEEDNISINNIGRTIVDLGIGVFGATTTLLSLPLQILRTLLSGGHGLEDAVQSIPCPPRGGVNVTNSVVGDLGVSALLVMAVRRRGWGNVYHEAMCEIRDNRKGRMEGNKGEEGGGGRGRDFGVLYDSFANTCHTEHGCLMLYLITAGNRGFRDYVSAR